MAAQHREKVTIEVDADLMDELRASVGDESELKALLENAVVALAASRRLQPRMAVRAEVMAAYEKARSNSAGFTSNWRNER
jgi:hypothetical protein